MKYFWLVINTLLPYLVKSTTCNLQEAEAHQHLTYYWPRDVGLMVLGFSLTLLLAAFMSISLLLCTEYNTLLNISDLCQRVRGCAHTHTHKRREHKLLQNNM